MACDHIFIIFYIKTSGFFKLKKKEENEAGESAPTRKTNSNADFKIKNLFQDDIGVPKALQGAWQDFACHYFTEADATFSGGRFG